jgi:hypothetical protein
LPAGFGQRLFRRHYRTDIRVAVTRAFCGDCGSPLFVKEVAIPDIVSINVGSLDDPSRYSPTGDWWTSSAQPWDHMNPDLEKFTTQPEA